LPLQGELKDFPLEDIIDLLNEGGKTGVLEIEYEEEFNKYKISIYFKNGEVVYATDNVSKTGIAVIETAAKLFDGKFIFVPGEVTVQSEEFKNINFEQFKLRFQSIMDKWKPLKQAFPTLNSTIYLQEKTPEKLNLKRLEWDVIAAIGDGLTIKELLEKLNIGELTLLETLLALKQKNLIGIRKEEEISREILNYIPRKVRTVLFAHSKEIEDPIAKKVYELIDGKRTIKEISNQARISAVKVKDAILYLAEIGKVAKPDF